MALLEVIYEGTSVDQRCHLVQPVAQGCLCHGLSWPSREKESPEGRGAAGTRGQDDLLGPWRRADWPGVHLPRAMPKEAMVC